MADPASAAARNAGDPDDEDRPDLDAIDRALASGWLADQADARRHLTALSKECRRLRTAAGIK